MQKKNAEHILVAIGKARFADPHRNVVGFVDDPTGNAFLNDIEHYPHAYVLACGMDRQTKSERAWMVPLHIRKILGDFEMSTLVKLSANDYRDIFGRHSLHRFHAKMAEVFFSAVQRIADQYDGDAARIWGGCPGSASVVYRFLEFKGYGIKIATMATNILARQFKVPLSDYYSIDISPDVHILRVLRRSGLVDSTASNDLVIYKVRELSPDFPGVIDFSCWEIGRGWCHPQNPNCVSCPLSSECVKAL